MSVKDESGPKEWSISVHAPVGGGNCDVVLWDGTRLDGPKGKYFAELQALCGDFEFLLNDPIFFEMEYDPDSFSDDIILWAQTEFEPSVNTLVKRQLLSFDLSDDQHFSMLIHKPQSKTPSDDHNDDPDPDQPDPPSPT